MPEIKRTLNIKNFNDYSQQIKAIEADCARAEKGQKVDLTVTVEKLQKLTQAVRADGVAISKEKKVSAEVQKAYTLCDQSLTEVSARVDTQVSKLNQTPTWVKPALYSALALAGVAATFAAYNSGMFTSIPLPPNPPPSSNPVPPPSPSGSPVGSNPLATNPTPTVTPGTSTPGSIPDPLNTIPSGSLPPVPGTAPNFFSAPPDFSVPVAPAPTPSSPSATVSVPPAADPKGTPAPTPSVSSTPASVPPKAEPKGTPAPTPSVSSTPASVPPKAEPKGTTAPTPSVSSTPASVPPKEEPKGTPTPSTLPPTDPIPLVINPHASTTGTPNTPPAPVKPKVTITTEPLVVNLKDPFTNVTGSTRWTHAGLVKQRGEDILASGKWGTLTDLPRAVCSTASLDAFLACQAKANTFHISQVTFQHAFGSKADLSLEGARDLYHGIIATIPKILDAIQTEQCLDKANAASVMRGETMHYIRSRMNSRVLAAFLPYFEWFNHGTFNKGDFAYLVGKYAHQDNKAEICKKITEAAQRTNLGVDGLVETSKALTAAGVSLGKTLGNNPVGNTIKTNPQIGLLTTCASMVTGVANVLFKLPGIVQAARPVKLGAAAPVARRIRAAQAVRANGVLAKRIQTTLIAGTAVVVAAGVGMAVPVAVVGGSYGLYKAAEALNLV